MKLFLNLSLFLFTLVILDNKSISLTDYKIKKICKKARKESICIKNLQEKRSDLQQGNHIEIPVFPFRN